MNKSGVALFLVKWLIRGIQFNMTVFVKKVHQHALILCFGLLKKSNVVFLLCWVQN